jgi:hypothetical protein
MCGTFAWLVSGNAVWPIGSGGGGRATNGSIGGSDLLGAAGSDRIGSYNLWAMILSQEKT